MLRIHLLGILFFFISTDSYTQEFQVTFDDAPAPSKKEILQDKISGSEASSQVNYAAEKDTLRALIVEKARKYEGVGYRYGQANEQGFDCSGYVSYVYSCFNFSLPHSSLAQYKLSRHLKERNARPGDLVFFITRGNQISHVGIYLGDNSFIHSPGQGKKVCVESLDSAYFRKHLAGFGSVLR